MLKPTHLGLVVLLFILALSFRLWYLFSVQALLERPYRKVYQQLPASPLYESDASLYDSRARKLVNEGQFPFPYQPPGWVVFLAFIYFVFGLKMVVGKVVLGVLSSLSVVFIFFIGNTLFNSQTGALAALLSALSFGQIVLPASLNSETLYQFLYLLVFLVAIRYSIKSHLRLLIICGILSGLTILVRAEFLLVAPALIIWFLFKRKIDTKQKLRVSLIYLSLIGLCLAPNALYNRHLIRTNPVETIRQIEYIPIISYHGPINFMLGNHEEATGTYSSGMLAYIKRMNLRHPQTIYFINHGFELGLEYIKSHPIEWLKLVMKKWQHTIGGLVYGYSRGNLGGGRRGILTTGDVYLPEGRVFFWLHLFGLVIGLAFLIIKRNRYVFLILIPIITNLITAGLFFGLRRSTLVIMPILYLAMVFPLAQLLKKYFTFGKRFAIILVAGILLIVGVDLYTRGFDMVVRHHMTLNPELKKVTIMNPR